MIKGIIFDIDGVVLDSMVIWQDLGKRYIKSLGKEPEDNLSRILFSMSMEEGADYLNRQYHLDKDIGLIVDELGRLIEQFYFDEVSIKKGIPELLNYCKAENICITAATSSMRNHIERALARNGILDFFKGILTTSEVGESKHNPLIYRMAASDMRLSPDEILVLEDSLYALETAQKAGFYVAGVYDSFSEQNQDGIVGRVDNVIYDFEQVTELIKNYSE